MAGCGGNGQGTSIRKVSVANAGSIGKEQYGSDRDNDNDHNDDDWHVLDFGHVADRSDTQAISVLVKHYYAAAAAENGARACALLTPFVAESVVEEHEADPDVRGPSCAEVMRKIFTRYRRELTQKNLSLKIARIGVEGDRSLIALSFPEIPEVRQITARYAAGRWTILRLLDDIIE